MARSLSTSFGDDIANAFGSVFGSYTPPPPPKAVTTPTTMTPGQVGAFNPYNDINRGRTDPFTNNNFAQTYGSAEDVKKYGATALQAADAALMGGYNAPTPIAAPTVKAPAPRANVAGVGAGIDRAWDALGDTNKSRGMQTDVYGTAMDFATGAMPSAGAAMAGEAGVIANEQFLRAGSEANQAYGSAAATAGRAYGDAVAEQNRATYAAGRDAARTTRDAAADSILRAAALSSMARGNNIGMALRTGMQGAAAQNQSANVNAARALSDANTAASYNSAAAQRAAQYADLQSNLATQGTHERTATAAAAAEEAARFRAAEIEAKAQLDALGLASNAATATRTGDIGVVGAATGVANTALGADTLITNTDQANAEREFRASTFNTTMQTELAKFAQQMGLSYDQLNSSNINAVAGRGLQSMLAGLAQQGVMVGQATTQQYNLAMADIMASQELAKIFVGLDEANKQRMLDVYIAQQGGATERRGQNIGIFGGASQGAGAGLAAAVMSDKRAKKDIRRTGAPDFRKAGSYSYKYKDTRLPGTSPGKQRGPMAQELPENVVTTGPDGYKRVDIGKLALALTSAVGDLQRRVA